VLDDEAVCLVIGLQGYNDFFQHKLWSIPDTVKLYFSFKVSNIMKKLPIQFFERTDVVLIAQQLIGKIVVTHFNGLITSGRIVETEAYIGITDRASHSFDGRRTARNEHMYASAGTVYVYICYGMHHLFNIVCNAENNPDAVLIRAVEPISGIDIMLARTGKQGLDNTLTRGPGNVAKALGISKIHSGINLDQGDIYIAEDGLSIPEFSIGASRRIGIEGSGDAALLPYRFFVKGNRFVSSYPNK
jgi:DNA-3-methyladenine glycosylase